MLKLRSPTGTIGGAVVAFIVDGTLRREDDSAPYDMRGTLTNGGARDKPGLLSPGVHTMTVEFRLPGGLVVTRTATFTVVR